MTDTSIEAVFGCPPPPRMVRAAGQQLQIARAGTSEQVKKLGALDKLPRPWLPHTCHPRLLRVLLLWLDDVAAWLNHDYSWRVTRPIPDCWPEHPHIVQELAGIAWLRVIAEESLEIGPIEEWHRYALPSFLSRLAERLGTGCSSKHDTWPGRPRETSYRSSDSVHARRRAIDRLVQLQILSAGERGPARGEQLELDTYGGHELDPPWEHQGDQE